MSAKHAAAQEYILSQLEKLSGDLDFSQDVSLDTLLFTELGFESLDAVILGVAIQDHFGRQMPFAELFADLGKNQRDLSVRELVSFTEKYLDPVSTPNGSVGACG